MSRLTQPNLRPNEISYLLEARIRGVEANRLTAVRFGQKDEEFLKPPVPPNRYHNPFGDDFTTGDLQIGAR